MEEGLSIDEEELPDVSNTTRLLNATLADVVYAKGDGAFPSDRDRVDADAQKQPILSINGMYVADARKEDLIKFCSNNNFHLTSRQTKYKNKVLWAIYEKAAQDNSGAKEIDLPESILESITSTTLDRFPVMLYLFALKHKEQSDVFKITSSGWLVIGKLNEFKAEKVRAFFGMGWNTFLQVSSYDIIMRTV